MLTPDLKAEYLRDPCGASSLPYWKTLSVPVGENMRIVRDDEFDAAAFPGFADTPYFRLIRRMEGLEKPRLSEGYRLSGAPVGLFSAHIRACYGGGPSEAELNGYLSRPVYDPALWLAVSDGRGGVAATGVGELDPDIREGVIEWIQVSPGHRRRGLGEFLVRELIWRMRGKADFVTVSCLAESGVKPVELYKKCGFGGAVIWHVLTKEG